jgi:hypothetical protein
MILTSTSAHHVANWSKPAACSDNDPTGLARRVADLRRCGVHIMGNSIAVSDPRIFRRHFHQDLLIDTPEPIVPLPVTHDNVLYHS